jgi:hypothetical protein
MDAKNASYCCLRLNRVFMSLVTVKDKLRIVYDIVYVFMYL